MTLWNSDIMLLKEGNKMLSRWALFGSKSTHKKAVIVKNLKFGELIHQLNPSWKGEIVMVPLSTKIRTTPKQEKKRSNIPVQRRSKITWCYSCNVIRIGLTSHSNKYTSIGMINYIFCYSLLTSICLASTLDLTYKLWSIIWAISWWHLR